MVIEFSVRQFQIEFARFHREKWIILTIYPIRRMLWLLGFVLEYLQIMQYNHNKMYIILFFIK